MQQIVFTLKIYAYSEGYEFPLSHSNSHQHHARYQNWIIICFLYPFFIPFRGPSSFLSPTYIAIIWFYNIKWCSVSAFSWTLKNHLLTNSNWPLIWHCLIWQCKLYTDDTYISGVGIHFAASTFILTQESPTFVVKMWWGRARSVLEANCYQRRHLN